MRLSFVTPYESLNIHNWSGLSYYISKALQVQGIDVDYIDNLKIEHLLAKKLKSIMYSKIRGEKYLKERSINVSRQYALQVERRIKSNSQIIFSPGSVPVAQLNTKKPIVFYTDATFAGMIDFYDGFSNLCKKTIQHGHYLEQSALDKCSLALYASDWAAKTAIDNYNVNPNKVKVVPFGANIEHNNTLQDIESIVHNRSKDICKLLFIGVDWVRKGGDLAINVAEQLIKLGIKTELHIVGLKTLPIKNIPEFVINHGFISKATQQGKQKIENLLISSNFLIVPSIAEAYGLVFCEASSYGLPSLARKVGGIPTVIKNNVNGKTFPPDCEVAEYARFIIEHFTDYTKYREIAYSSFAEYQKRLNWNVAGKSIANMLEHL